MAGKGRLKICLDECLGVKIAAILRDARAPGAPEIHSIQELALRGVADEVLFGELKKQSFVAMVTKDSAILSAAIRRQAWQGSGLKLFIMDGRCGNLPLFEQVRRLIWWWPAIASEATGSEAPGAWTIKHIMQGELERRI